MDNKDIGRSPALQGRAGGPSDLSPSGSQPEALVPNAGQYVIYDDGFSVFSNYVCREIERVTPKMLLLARGRYPGRIERKRAIAFCDDRDTALRACQSLAGVHGEYRRRVEAAQDEFTRRQADAQAAKNKAIAKLFAHASGIVAATAGETTCGLDERSEQSPAAEGGDAL